MVLDRQRTFLPAGHVRVKCRRSHLGRAHLNGLSDRAAKVDVIMVVPVATTAVAVGDSTAKEPQKMRAPFVEHTIMLLTSQA